MYLRAAANKNSLRSKLLRTTSVGFSSSLQEVEVKPKLASNVHRWSPKKPWAVQDDKAKLAFDTADAKKDFFLGLAETSGSDHDHIKYVKGKIGKLMEQELDLLGFKEQLSKEELEALESDALNEVTTHSSFYFKVDANKVDKNLKIYNVNAPGNKHRHPSVALPHEEVHI